MFKKTIGLFLLAVGYVGGLGAAGPDAEGARLYFISPVDGATVSSPVTVRFGLSGFGVAPAGVQNAKAGHHHLIIDSELPPLDRPVPTDDHHRHFGGGQTEAEISLPPGEHTLQLLLGDYAHTPHNPAIISERITIIVE
ncbi:MAG: DUF4399 domain-containing protein [Gammaproteobacteria bacterium]